MTKQAVLPAHTDIVEVEVEIDAMDVAEWESGQRTPQASDPKLAELVRRTAKLPALTADGEPMSSLPVHRARKKTATLVAARRPPAVPAVPPRLTATGSVPKLAALQHKAPLPVLRTDGELEATVPFIYTSADGAADAEPPSPALPAFAEPSRVGPGHQASPAGSVEPNTAWPPRPIPAGLSSSSDRLAASGVMPRTTGHEAEVTHRLPVVLTRPRLGWIAGMVGGISLGVVVATALLGAPEPGRAPSPGEDHAPSSAHQASEVAAALAAPSAVPVTAGGPTLPSTPPMPDGAPPRDATTEVEPPAVVIAPTPAPVPAHAAKRIAGKKVVVDYTAQPSDAPPSSLVAQTQEDPAIGRARTAYATGNQQLFAGDTDGAIRAYQRALELYPGYVGGYRGLGLAYAQAGDNASALTALRAYVSAVPGARDAALIKKRIAHLQGK